MNDNNEIRLPGDVVTLNPSAEPTFTYRQEDGHDIIGVLFPDATLGSFALNMTPSLATFIGKNIVAMAEEIAELRRQWDEHHQEGTP